MPLACCGAGKPNSHRTKKPYRPRRERASTSSCLTLFRLDCRCSKSSALGGWAIGALFNLFRLNSSLMKAATWSKLSLIRIVHLLACLPHMQDIHFFTSLFGKAFPIARLVRGHKEPLFLKEDVATAGMYYFQ